MAQSDVGYVTIVSGTAQTISVSTSPGGAQAIRIFDTCLIATDAIVTFYAGTNSLAANRIIELNKLNPQVSFTEGLRVEGGLYQSTSAVANRIAIVTYAREF